MPTTIASDNFDRANGALGANWQDHPSVDTETITIADNQAIGTPSGNFAHAEWIGAGSFDADHWSEFVLGGTGSGGNVRIWVRSTGPSDGYLFQIRRSDGNWALFSFGAAGLIDSGTISPNEDDVYRMEIVGTSLSVKANGAAFLGPYTVNDYASGGPVTIGLNNGAAGMKSWQAGNMADAASGNPWNYYAQMMARTRSELRRRWRRRGRIIVPDYAFSRKVA